MKCPRCNSRELWIVVHFSGQVLCESRWDDEITIRESASLHSDFDDESPCRCDACHWTGAVHEVKEQDPADEAGGRVRTRNSPVTSLAEVRRRLKAQPCPVVWSECIRYLIKRSEAYESLAKQHEELLQADKKKREKKGPESYDTTIM